MLRLNERVGFSLILLAFAVLLLVEASGLRPRAALLPQIIGFPFLVGSFIVLLGDLFPAIERRFKRFFYAGVNSMDGAAEGEADTLRGLYAFMLWMLLTLILIYALGVIGGLWLALMGYLKFMVQRTWVFSLLYASLLCLFIYVVFVLIMDVYYFVLPVHQW